MSAQDTSAPPPEPIPPDDRPPSEVERQPAPTVEPPASPPPTTAEAPRRSAAWAAVRGLVAIPLAMLGQLLGALGGYALGDLGSIPLMTSLASACAIGVLMAWWLLATRQDLVALGFAPGARRIARGLGLGFAAGCGLMGIVVGIGCLAGAWTVAPGNPAWLPILGWTVALVLAACFEEVLLRGHVLQELGRRHVGIGLAVSSSIFAVIHLGNPNVFSQGALVVSLLLANIVLAGLLLSAAMLSSRDLWLPTGLHFGWNWCQAILLGLPVSGVDMPSVLEGTVSKSAPRWLSSDFGPESSVVAAVVLAAVAAPWLVALLRRGATLPAHEIPAVPPPPPPAEPPPSSTEPPPAPLA